MSESLARLVMDRAPFSGANFAVLLFAAVMADEQDHVALTMRSAAKGMRLRSDSARRSMRDLEKDGYLHVLKSRTPRRGDRKAYLLRRDTLLKQPPQNPVCTSLTPRQVDDELTAFVKEQVEKVHRALRQKE